MRKPAVTERVGGLLPALSVMFDGVGVTVEGLGNAGESHDVFIRHANLARGSWPTGDTADTDERVSEGEDNRMTSIRWLADAAFHSDARRRGGRDADEVD